MIEVVWAPNLNLRTNKIWKAKFSKKHGYLLIFCLLFADDTLVFCEESQDQLTYLSWLLMWFEACSGLRINLEKSELIPMGRVH